MRAITTAVLFLTLYIVLFNPFASAGPTESRVPPAQKTGGAALAVSYIVYQIGDAIYAQNGLTRRIEKSGWKAVDVIQYAVDKAEGGTVVIKRGRYVLDKPILLPRFGCLQGEGMGTVLAQSNPEECGLLYIGDWRQIEVQKAEKKGEPLDEENLRHYRKYGVRGAHHVGLRIRDLQLVGPGAEGNGDGIRLEYANSYGGPCAIEGVWVHHFGAWQIYAWHCYGGAFIVRDSKIGAGWVGDGMYFTFCHGGRVANVEIHDIKKGGTGVYVTSSLAFSLDSVVSENNKQMMGKAFLIENGHSTTLQSCYSEQSEYGVLIKNTKGPVTIAGCHLSNWQPVRIEGSENVIIEGITSECPPKNWNIFAADDCRNIRVGLNNYWKGRGYNRAAK